MIRNAVFIATFVLVSLFVAVGLCFMLGGLFSDTTGQLITFGMGVLWLSVTTTVIKYKRARKIKS